VVNPVIELVYEPVPEPSVVLLFAIVGVGSVLQQTPRVIMSEPPVAVIVPPLLAVVCVISVIAEVVNSGIIASVVVNEKLIP
jgi:hypothetical protein